jgi:hypothetical protein
LSNNFIFTDYEQQFNDACQIIAQCFFRIIFSDFADLTNKSLEKILSLDTLLLLSENFLLERIIENHSKTHLMKFVIFPAIDYQLLKQLKKYLFVLSFPFHCLVFDRNCLNKSAYTYEIGLYRSVAGVFHCGTIFPLTLIYLFFVQMNYP